VRLDRQPGYVPARFGETCDETTADGIDRHRKDNGNTRCRLLYYGNGAPNSYDDVDFEADKLSCNFGVALGTAFRPPILNVDGLAFDPTQLSQAGHKSGYPWSET